jgi:two-component system chemotaxis sensor kinase CheA
MNPLLLQFLAESREINHSIGEQLLQLNAAAKGADRNRELFLAILRQVRTLKGNCSLFDFPEMARVLHAADDLLALARDGHLVCSPELSARLRQANGFLLLLLDDIEAAGQTDGSRAQASLQLAASLRQLIPLGVAPADALDPAQQQHPASPGPQAWARLAQIPEPTRSEALRQYHEGQTLHWVVYTPAPDASPQEADPFFLARQTPGLLWGSAIPARPLPPLTQLGAAPCLLQFHLLTAAPRDRIEAHFNPLEDQVTLVLVAPEWLKPPEANSATDAAAIPEANPSPALQNGPQGAESPPDPATSQPPQAISTGELLDELVAAYDAILSAQQQILMLEDRPEWTVGRLAAVGIVLQNLARAAGDEEDVAEIEAVLSECMPTGQGALLLMWLQSTEDEMIERYAALAAALLGVPTAPAASGPAPADPASASATPAGSEPPLRFGRRAEDALTAHILKVQQEKIDRLLSLVAELEVEKNALPLLAQRALEQHAAPELASEIRSQHAALSGITCEMQDIILQVRMLPLSFVFQRLPRQVRNLARKLGKRVELVIEGEQTEADKNIVEALADPLAQIVRNSLIHGLEIPEVRRLRCKRETGLLAIRAIQEAGHVLIEITDDGKGIDPTVIKRRAYEKQLFSEPELEQMDDREAINLIFSPGLSPAAVFSEPDTPAFGLDRVRDAVEKLGGAVSIESEFGLGATVLIAIPLSLAILQVMVVESGEKLYGVPMDLVVEKLHLPRAALQASDSGLTAELHGQIVPLKPLHALLGIAAEPLANSADELAILVVHSGENFLGLIVDDFREAIGIVRKPAPGIPSPSAATTAQLADGSEIAILNLPELLG